MAENPYLTWSKFLAGVQASERWNELSRMPASLLEQSAVELEELAFELVVESDTRG